MTGIPLSLVFNHRNTNKKFYLAPKHTYLFTVFSKHPQYSVPKYFSALEGFKSLSEDCKQEGVCLLTVGLLDNYQEDLEKMGVVLPNFATPDEAVTSAKRVNLWEGDLDFADPTQPLL